ncbi:MAG TPA: HDOD domain-containing protein [Planctomycetota bacterium]|nr:HDOD domain-containing protein [Planctomycetota bacterium]
MSKQEAQKRLSDKVSLPTLPEIVTRITAMVEDPNVRIRDIGAVVAQDPAITATVLRIANSAYYGLAKAAISPEEAAAVIGGRSLRNIALQASIIGKFEHLSRKFDFDLHELWVHAVFTAQLCQELARRLPHAPELGPEEFYTCGLLHDVGKAVLLDSLREEYAAVYRAAKESGEAIHLAEERMLSFTHVEVGALVAQRWQLPEPVCHAIRHHHGPREEVLSNPTTTVVALCDQLAYRIDTPEFAAALPRLAALAHDTLRVAPDDFGAFVEHAAVLRGQVQI